MSMKMVCNRCNRPKEDGESFDRIQYIYSDKPYNDFDYDLCPECAKRFNVFIHGGTVEEDNHKDSKPCAVVIHKLVNGNYAIENKLDFVDHVIDAVSDNPDDPCPCYAKRCANVTTCCGCKEYDEWKERQK